ncbi:MAG: hypothetical protein ACI84O_000727 [Myxococcota bacterium]|jgi:hypothetical protein
MVNETYQQEFSEIPELVKEQVANKVRRDIFDLLHLEAIQRGDISPPPPTSYDKLSGRIAKLFFHIGLGAFIGTVAVFVCVYTIRSLVTVL